VQTGIYSPSRYYGGFEGEEYEPAYLSQMKVHKILQFGHRGLRIEAIHVEKVNPVKKLPF
jgi:hypothetical protein